MGSSWWLVRALCWSVWSLFHLLALPYARAEGWRLSNGAVHGGMAWSCKQDSPVKGRWRRWSAAFALRVGAYLWGKSSKWKMISSVMAWKLWWLDTVTSALHLIETMSFVLDGRHSTLHPFWDPWGRKGSSLMDRNCILYQRMQYLNRNRWYWAYTEQHIVPIQAVKKKD